MSFLPPAILSAKAAKLPVALASTGPMPGPKPTNVVILPPALMAAGGAGAGAGVDLPPALKPKKRGARSTKAERLAEKAAEMRHKIGAVLATLIEEDASKAEVAKYFRMRVEQLTEEAA